MSSRDKMSVQDQSKERLGPLPPPGDDDSGEEGGDGDPPPQGEPPRGDGDGDGGVWTPGFAGGGGGVSVKPPPHPTSFLSPRPSRAAAPPELPPQRPPRRKGKAPPLPILIWAKGWGFMSGLRLSGAGGGGSRVPGSPDAPPGPPRGSLQDGQFGGAAPPRGPPRQRRPSLRLLPPPRCPAPGESRTHPLSPCPAPTGPAPFRRARPIL